MMHLEDQTVLRQGESTEPAQQSKGALTDDLSSQDVVERSHDTRIVIHHKILSMKHSPGVEAIMYKQPKEHLVSLLTTTIPHPFKRRIVPALPIRAL
jgi:hypothetical protein